MSAISYMLMTFPFIYLALTIHDYDLFCMFSFVYITYMEGYMF